ncbi:uncharacterized protein TNCV_633091 [Trichonephila clavipes]|nr:uncharacterized protein TNCV_633091 [Trichonephila clavipes]
MVRTGDVIHKHKFCAYGAPKQTYISLQNDVLILLACHGFNLNMQVSTGTQNNPPSHLNKQSSTTETVPFNDVLLGVTGTWCSPYESPTRIRLQAKPGLVGKHHTPTIGVSAMHALYSRLTVGDSEL